MLTRILATGLMAGVLAGLFVSGLQHATTVPLILKAETYEKSGAKPASSRYPNLGRKNLALAPRAVEPGAAPFEFFKAWANLSIRCAVFVS